MPPTREERIDQLAGSLITVRRRMDHDLKDRLKSERLRTVVEVSGLSIAAFLFIWLKDSLLTPLPQLLRISYDMIDYVNQIILVLILIGLALKGSRAIKSYFSKTAEIKRTFSNDIIEQIKNLNMGLKDDVVYDILEKTSYDQTFDAQKYAQQIVDNSIMK